METPPTSYLEHDGIKIAWQVFGDGPAEMLFVPGWVSNVDLFWQYPQSREFFTELAAFARVALYDKPGTGASDPVEVAPPVEERIDQLVHVMDAASLSRPTVIGVSEGGVTACLAAAARPDRVERLVLLDASAGLLDPRAKGEMSDAEHRAWAGLPPSDRGDVGRGARWGHLARRHTQCRRGVGPPSARLCLPRRRAEVLRVLGGRSLGVGRAARDPSAHARPATDR